MPQKLGSKERGLFSQVVAYYENKQYKRGLKAAEQILRKNPDHGETQAMKALILNSQGQRDDVLVLAKSALKNDMKSHVCWHVYGILYKDAKNFEESLKAYKFALKIEPTSQHIQRDLAQLQMQIRDYAGYIQSRRAMLQARPALRSNWTALAIAQHLGGDLEDAVRTLSAYEDSLRSPPPKSDLEHQQAIFYKNMIIAETGDIERALLHLDASTKNVNDLQLVMELRAEYLLRLGRKSDAEKSYRFLLERNHESRSYHQGLQSALEISGTNLNARREMFAELTKKYPTADAPCRMPLDFLSGDEFRNAADVYLRRMLTKGVPSTFANVKNLYSDKFKQDTIQALVEGYAKGNLDVNGNAQEIKDPERFEMSILFFLAQHYNYHKSRNLSKAMDLVEKLIAKDAKSVDFHMTQARILKHYGDIRKAAEVMNHARSLDERDRHINTKTAKYQLRNNEHELAVQTMGKFTRPDAGGGALGDLTDMQCVWFLAEDGESCLRQTKLGLALKRFTTIYNIFDLWQEDQYDFHSFSLRKGQIRAYIEMIRWEDHLRDHPFYTRAAIGACKAYTLLHDDPELAKGRLSNGTANGNSNEKKKAAKKARKAQEKQEQQEHEKKDAKKTAGVVENPVKKDPDSEGKLLLETTDPLKDAMKFLTPMLESSPQSLEAQRAGFEVFVRRKKPLLALRCLLATRALAPDSPNLHSQLLRLQLLLTTLPSPLPSTVADVIEQDFAPLLPKPNPDLNTLQSLNDDYLSKHADAASVFAGAEVRLALAPGKASKEAASKDFVKILEWEETSLEQAVEGLELLREWGAETDDFVKAAHARWSEATAFQ